MAEEVDVNAVQESSVEITQKSASAKEKKPVCRFYARTGRCKFEEKCRFFHVHKADTTNTRPDKRMQDNKEEIVSQTTQQETNQTTQQEANQTTQEEAKQTTQQEIEQTRLDESMQTTPLEAKQTNQHEANENTQHEANEDKQVETTGKTHQQDSKTSQKVCKFYKTRGGCIRGSACRFLHAKPTATKTISPQDNNTSKPNARKEESHKQVQAKKVVSTAEKLSLLGDEELNSLRTRELVQLVRRFGKAKQVQGPGTTYNINFSPTDPDWVRKHISATL